MTNEWLGRDCKYIGTLPEITTGEWRLAHMQDGTVVCVHTGGEHAPYIIRDGVLHQIKILTHVNVTVEQGHIVISKP